MFFISLQDKDMRPLRITSQLPSILLAGRIRLLQHPSLIVAGVGLSGPFLGHTYRLWPTADIHTSSASHQGLIDKIVPNLRRHPRNGTGKFPYTIDSHPKEISEGESWPDSKKALDNVIKKAAEIMKRQMTDVMESSALNNAFFPEGAKKILSSKAKAMVLVNYAALVQRTVPGTIQTLMAIHDPEGFRETVQNLHEEAGEGSGESHFVMLERFMNTLLKETGSPPIKRDRVGIVDDERVLSSTKQALKIQRQLFNGSFFGATPIGVTFPDEIPYWQRVAVSAVGAANENRAPFTQAAILQWLCKQFNFAERNNLRKVVEPYFACHLGEEATAAMFDGRKEVLSTEEWKVFTPEDLRRRGLVEFAHSKAACDTVIYLLSKETSVESAEQAFLEAQRFRREFLENHGCFWNGLAEAIGD